MENGTIKAGTKVIVQVNENGKKRFYNGIATFDQESVGAYIDLDGGLNIYAWFEGHVPGNIKPLKHFTIKEVLCSKTINRGDKVRIKSSGKIATVTCVWIEVGSQIMKLSDNDGRVWNGSFGSWDESQVEKV